ncbi:glycosyltransferase [Nocardioides nanhaiensis]|uniref:Glycosyltransferase n=1 Tax=Nocardioides nanhaiensis TaxID=1476871 RepID=A0ABP8W7F1_9ACTN
MRTPPTPPSSPTAAPLTRCAVDPALRHLAPEGLCRSFSLVPYAEQDGRLLVAAVDAEDLVAAHVLADRLGRPVELVAHTRAAVQDALDAAYPPLPAAAETPQQQHQRERLGQVLLRNGLVANSALQAGYVEHLTYLRDADTADTADTADHPHDAGVALGEVLVARGAIEEDALVAVLSELHDLQRVSLAHTAPTPELGGLLPLELALRARVVPVAERGTQLVLAAARPLDPATLEELRTVLGRPVALVLAAAPEVERLILGVHQLELTDVARSAVTDRPAAATGHPGRLPGHATTSWSHRALLALLALAAAGALVRRPGPALTLLAVALLLGACLVGVHRAVLTGRALRPANTPERPGSDCADAAAPLEVDDDPAVPPGRLPRYSVLVTLRRAVALPGLLAGLEAVDYPRSRLEVLLLCEESDATVREAVAQTLLPAHVRVVVVPDSHPATPAKARNLALALTRGELVTVLDEADRLDPRQLRAVAARFAADPGLACVQARLQHDVVEGSPALVAGWAAGALAVRSGLWVPAAVDAGSAVLLGESSHHVRSAVLRQLGGWDPHSQTPGAEFGVRLRRTGHRVGVVAAATWSPAPTDLRSWLRGSAARDRGLLTTALAHVRAPRRLVRDLGVRAAADLVLTTVGGLGRLVSPVLVLGAVAWVALRVGDLEPGPPAVQLLGLACLVAVLGAALGSAYLVLAGTLRLRRHDLVRSALLTPASWLLLSVAPLLPRPGASGVGRPREVCP